MEKTLVILKPSALNRRLAGEIITRFENKGLIIRGLKMMQLTPGILDEHYAHLTDKPFYPRIRAAMMATPVVVICVEGIDAVQVVHTMAGATNSRKAAPGTIRGDYSMSMQENIVHTSDSPETARKELARFFTQNEIFDYPVAANQFLYSEDEWNPKV